MIHTAFLLNLTSILNKFCPATTNTITYKTSNIINLCQNVHILITVLINICQHVPTTISHKGNCILLWRLLKYLVLTIVFCSPNFLIYCDGKFFYCDFSFFSSYQSRQKGTKGKFFEAEAKKWTDRGWEMFPEVPTCLLR